MLGRTPHVAGTLSVILNAPANVCRYFLSTKLNIHCLRSTMNPYLQKIETLLYGINYEVHFFTLFSEDKDIGLESYLKKEVSKSCELQFSQSVSIEYVIEELKEFLFYKGDVHSGPIDLEFKKDELELLLMKFVTEHSLNEAELITEFTFRKGHPLYPVFGEFCFDIHTENGRLVFIGSSKLLRNQ